MAFVHLENVKKITWVLSVHRRDQFAAIKLRVGEHWNLDIFGEQGLCFLCMSCTNKLNAVPPFIANRGVWNTVGAMSSSRLTVRT